MPQRDTKVMRARGRIGGLMKAANTKDRDSLTRAARDARWQRYLDQVPAHVTDPAERDRRALLIRRADMQRLSLRAAEARRKTPAADRARPDAA